MKYFKPITLPLFVLLMFATACVREVAEDVATDGLRLTLNIPGATVSRASGNELAGESSIYNVYLLFYPKEGSDDTTPPAFFYKETGLTDKETSWSHQFGELHLLALEEGTDYDVFAFASLPDATAAPTKTTTKGALMALTEQQFERSAEVPGISFTGKGSYKGGTAANLEIELIRTVARFDITLVNAPQSLTGMVGDEPLSTFYQPDMGVAADERTTQPLFKTGTDTYRCYVYENPADETPVRVQFVSTNDVGGDIAYSAEVNAGTGKNEIKRNYIYRLTLTFKDEGSLDIAMDDPINWSDETGVTPTVPDAVQVQPKANAYIVAPGGETLYIPVAQVNDASAFSSAVPSLSDTEQLTAELVWTDVKGATSGLGLAEDASIAEIGVIGVGQDAVLSVKPGSQPGNNVVAVRNQYGHIKWSWHIWVTDYDPEAEDGQKNYNGYIFMDRNLGAMSAEVAVNNANGVIGNYYQWGRKDPFPSKSWGTAALSFTPVYKADGTAASVTGANLTDMGKTVVQPFVFCTVNGSYLDANVTTAIENWGQSGEKTAFDPCPPGWRVPEKDAYFDMKVNFVPLVQDGGVNAGYQEKHCGFFPYTWDLNYADATVYNNPTNFFLWTANAVNRTTAYNFQSMASATQNVSWGFPVRCVRDWTKGKRKNEVRVMMVGDFQLSSGHPLDATARAQHLRADYIVPMTSVNFGPGEKVDATFKYYSLGNVTDNTVTILEQNDIDVLYITANQATTAAQAQAIKSWVEASPNHVLMYSIEYVNSNTLSQALGGFNCTPETQIGTVNYTLVNDVSSPANQAIVKGPYGEITNNSFLYVQNSGCISKADADANGFVPLLATANNADRYTLAYHPQWRVLLVGDTDYFGATNGAGNKNGSLTPTAKGEYPLLVANLWAWIARTALTGR